MRHSATRNLSCAALSEAVTGSKSGTSVDTCHTCTRDTSHDIAPVYISNDITH
jgi:hypothetical protein